MYIGPDGVDQSAVFNTDDEYRPFALGQLIQISGGLIALVIIVIKSSLCFSKPVEDDPERVASFQISPWSCLCNIFRSPEHLSCEPDDFRFTTCSVKSMDISVPEENTGRSYLPNGVDGLGVATKKYLESGGQMSKLEPKERQNVSDSKVIMKAYLISKLVAARYTFQDGQIEFNEGAENSHIDIMEYKERTQNMYDLLYAGQISVDTRATKRQQKVALKRLKKSNLNLRPSKIKELARQMKKEAETGASNTESKQQATDTISSGIESGDQDSYDISKADSQTVKSCAKTVHSTATKRTQSSAMTRLMLRLGLKNIPGVEDSAVGMSSGSSLGSCEEMPPVKTVTVVGGGGGATRVHNYGGAQF